MRAIRWSERRHARQGRACLRGDGEKGSFDDGAQTRIKFSRLLFETRRGAPSFRLGGCATLEREPRAAHRSRRRPSRAAACSTRSDACSTRSDVASRSSSSPPRPNPPPSAPDPSRQCVRSRASRRARTTGVLRPRSACGRLRHAVGLDNENTRASAFAGARSVSRMIVITGDHAGTVTRAGRTSSSAKRTHPSLSETLCLQRSISPLPERVEPKKKVLACSLASQDIGRPLFFGIGARIMAVEAGHDPNNRRHPLKN